ncbi:MAG: aminopeptidase P family protein [Candidatus Aminicenantes bacterium]|nr:MAG: aminopeptidase P family protein [Candidatus Aminicenantes bacterium]
MKHRVQALRVLMKKFGLDAYLVPSTDPHMDEYIPEFWQRRKYISGFRGSAGDVVITRSKAGLWTDSRYFLQAERELDSGIFTLFKQGIPGIPTIKEWLAKELGKDEILGVDPQVISHQNFEDLHYFLKKRGIRVKCVPKNLVDLIWIERSSYSKEKILVHPIKYAGESTKKKLGRIREKMSEQSKDLLVVTALDEIAWLFNIRGRDIKYNPVVIAYALIFKNRAMLFIDLDKLTRKTQHHLKNSAEILAYEKFFPALREFCQKSKHVWVDENQVNQRIVNTLKRYTKIHLSSGPIPKLKAVKNKTEIQGFRSAHVRDGAAMVKFLFWLSQSLQRHRITEIRAAAKLAEFRARSTFFQGLSFETISAYRTHSAIVHYGATPETDIPLQKKDIYLIDSGAQYSDATTDITRTICLGRPRTQHKECFTRVLKGLIALSMTSFPQGTAGRQLDTIARLPLWRNGQNYGHGTGHGIGTYLNVHEGPHAISPQRCVGVALEPGMITTIEPGIYLEDQFGIRLENAVLTVEDEKNSTENSTFYKFETLTLCPIDLNLVKMSLLRQEEIAWLNAYHKRVQIILSPLVSKQEQTWLAKATRTI